MPVRKKHPREDTADVSRSRLAKMSDEERVEIKRAVQRAIDQRDLTKFKAALLKLGFDEESAAYQEMMKLWDEHAKFSRRP